MTKKSLRQETLQALAAYCNTLEKKEEETLLYERLVSLPLFKQAHNIGIYRSLSHEVNTWPIIQQAFLDKQVSVPVVTNKRLVFKEITPTTRYSESSFGILEPVEARTVEVSTLDLLIVPGVAFTNSGSRLGYGGGYYDRLLANHSLPTISLAMALQLVAEELLPTEPHDQKINQILTV